MTDLIVEADTFRVARRAFVDVEVYTREQTAIFDRCWLFVAHRSELPNAGDFLTRTVAGRALLVTHGDDGALRAMLNRCAHRGMTVCPLASGHARSFRCPYHAWTYDLNGRLRGVPGREAYRDVATLDGVGLPSVRINHYRDFYFVTFDPSAGSLADYLAGAKEYLDLIVDQSLGTGMEVVPGSQRYGIEANWKLLAENSIDTYHVAALHGRYLDYVADQNVRLTAPRGRALDLGNGHAASLSQPPIAAKPVAYWGPPMPISRKPAIAALQRELVATHGEQRARTIGQTYRQLLIFPNLIINDTCATTIRSWEPVGPHRIHVTARALVPRNLAPEDRELALKSFLVFFGPGGFATPDDIEILETLQRCFTSASDGWVDCSRGMQRAEPAFDDELQLRAFWRRWRELMFGVVGGTR